MHLHHPLDERFCFLLFPPFFLLLSISICIIIILDDLLSFGNGVPLPQKNRPYSLFQSCVTRPLNQLQLFLFLENVNLWPWVLWPNLLIMIIVLTNKIKPCENLPAEHKREPKHVQPKPNHQGSFQQREHRQILLQKHHQLH